MFYDEYLDDEKQGTKGMQHKNQRTYLLKQWIFIVT